MAGMAKPIKKTDIKTVKGKPKELTEEQIKWASEPHSNEDIDQPVKKQSKRDATNVLIRLNSDELLKLDSLRAKIGTSRAGFFRMAFLEKAEKMINDNNK